MISKLLIGSDIEALSLEDRELLTELLTTIESNRKQTDSPIKLDGVFVNVDHPNFTDVMRLLESV